jgi:hypothetical protein
MKRGSTTHVSVGTAFARSVRGADGVVPDTQRLHPGAIAFVAGFPGVIGVAMVLAAFSRDGPNDGAFAPGMIIAAVAGLLLVLATAPAASPLMVNVEPDRTTVPASDVTT